MKTNKYVPIRVTKEKTIILFLFLIILGFLALSFEQHKVINQLSNTIIQETVKIRDLEGRIDDLESKVEEYDSKFEELEGKNGDLESRINDIESRSYYIRY